MESVDFTSVILPQIVLDLGMIMVLKNIVMIIIPMKIMGHCIGKVVCCPCLIMLHKWLLEMAF